MASEGGGQIAPTIKATYYKVSVANFIHNDGLRAPYIIEYEEN